MSLKWLLPVLLVGCSKPEAKKPIHVDVSFPDASAKVADEAVSPELATRARAALDAANTLASKCKLYIRDWEERGWKRAVPSCGIFKKADVQAMTTARKALDATAGIPDAGFAASFVRLVDRFDDAVSHLPKSDEGYWARTDFPASVRYQEIALAWNDWRPKDTVPVDVGTNKDAYDGKPFEIDAGPSGHVEWQNCSDAPCIVINVPVAKR